MSVPKRRMSGKQHPHSIPREGHSLADLFPSVAKLWHPELNGEYTPNQIKPKSNFHFWWLCQESNCEHEHVWEAPTDRLIQSIQKSGATGCPHCSGLMYCECNSLLGKFPNICEEWDYERNEGITPDKVAPLSNSKAWWICRDCGHNFYRVVSESHRYGCPCCAGQQVHSDGSNSLSALEPAIAGEWHPSKNGEIGPEDVTVGSTKKRWWQCVECEHEWRTQINVKVKYGCPYCKAGRLHSDRRNSLANICPEICEELHPDSLAEFDANEVSKSSYKRVIWQCKDCSHEWSTTIKDRAYNESGCPCCAGQAVHSDGHNSMANTNPELAAEFHPSKNGDMTPQNLLAGTNKGVWWQCRECDNEWKVSGGTRLYQPSGSVTGCPYCNRGNLHSDGRNSMRNIDPKLTSEFHPTRNGKLTPDDVIASTNRKIWWKCSDCEHEWRALGESRDRGSGCPCCSGQVLHFEGRNSMRKTHPEIADDFHPTRNGKLTPETMMLGTQRKLWWKCSVCENEWRASGSRRKLGSGCPSCRRGDLHSDRRNSVMNVDPDLAAEFHPTKNGKLTTNEFTVGSGRKVWWLCPDKECGHSWKTAVLNRRNMRTGCPKCQKVGFQLDKPAYYYVIRVMKGDRILCWKGGISSDYSRRIRQHRNLLSSSRFSRYKLELHETTYFEIGEDALEFENKLLRTFDIRAPDMEDFSSELFIENPLEYARSIGLVH